VHHGDLRDALRREARLVEEDAAEVLAVRKHLVLFRQKRPAAFDQVDAGQAVLAGDLLGAQVLLHRERVVRAALHRRIVGNDHAGAPGDAADAGDETRTGQLVGVDPLRSQGRELEKRRAGVQQRIDALAHQELARLTMLGAGRLAAAPGVVRQRPLQLAHQRLHSGAIRGEVRRARVDAGGQSSHAGGGW
jgi:hypothetical protein